MTRRDWLAGAFAAAAPRVKLDRSRFSVLTDEVGPELTPAVKFARQYGLSWVELRFEPGVGAYESMPAARLKEAARQLADNGLRVSFLNSTLLKFTLPGTTAVASEDFYVKLYAQMGVTAETLYRNRLDQLRCALDAAQILGVNALRAFTFWRTKDPRAVFPRIAEILGQMAPVAQQAGCRILVENETATNAASSEEIAALLEMLPSPAIGMNWDPQNSVRFDPLVFPDGYRRLPKERIGNVQIKAEGLIGPGTRLDWAGIMRTMLEDGYQGRFGLETHTEKSTEVNLKASHTCVRKMLRIADASPDL